MRGNTLLSRYNAVANNFKNMCDSDFCNFLQLTRNVTETYI